MSKRLAAKVSMALVAAMLLTMLAVVPAYAAEAAPAKTTAAAATAPAGEGAAETKAEGSTNEAAGEKKEIPHVVGHPSESQLVDLRNAWSGIQGYDILIVAILGMLATVGIIGFGAFKQSKV